MSDENSPTEKQQEQQKQEDLQKVYTQQEIQAEIKKQFGKIKAKLKHHSKSELIKMLWNQGVEFKHLQQVGQELYEENKILKQQLAPKKEEEESNESV